jgi:integrase
MGDLYAATVNAWKLKGRKSFGDLERRWAYLEAHFADIPADTVDFDAISTYAAERLKGGAAPATVQKELRYLHHGFELVARSRLLHVPPFPTIVVENARQEFIDDDEFFAIEKGLSPDLRGFFRFKWLTGWRNSEVAGLTWEKHVDFERGMVKLLPYTTKNRDAREFPFHYLPSLEVLLREQRAHTDELERRLGKTIATVFWRNSRNAYDGIPVNEFRVCWKRACERAGLPGKKPHDFRRTAIRRLELAGVPRAAAKKLVGHKTDEAYNRYAICPPQDLIEGTRRLAVFMGEAPPSEVKPGAESKAPPPPPESKPAVPVAPTPTPVATPVPQETDPWQSVVEAWWQVHGENQVGAQDLMLAVEGSGMDLGNGSDAARGARLAFMVAAVRNRVFTVEGGVRVRIRPERGTYRLERVGDGAL